MQEGQLAGMSRGLVTGGSIFESSAAGRETDGALLGSMDLHDQDGGSCVVLHVQIPRLAGPPRFFAAPGPEASVRERRSCRGRTRSFTRWSLSLAGRFGRGCTRRWASITGVAVLLPDRGDPSEKCRCQRPWKTRICDGFF